MLLQDAGAKADLTRSQRAHDVVDAILRRVDGDVVYSVIGFYTDAMPVIVDAEDAELVRNVFDGLPIWYVMKAGKTDLGTGVRGRSNIWATIPTAARPCSSDRRRHDRLGRDSQAPGLGARRYVLGVGDPQQGTFIDGHMSRQDASLLGTLAGRWAGKYLDVNEKHVPTLTLGSGRAVGAPRHRTAWWIWRFSCWPRRPSSALIPVLLEYLGSDWKTVRSPASPTERAAP